MSSHADTIRRHMRWGSDDDTNPVTRQEAWTALDALLAGKQRLREALERIKRESGNAGFVPSRVAREALAGDEE